MAHSLSSKKRMRQNVKRRAINRAGRSMLKTSIRSAADAFGAGNTDAAVQVVRETTKALDREASKGLIHKNTAARRKSRLARKLNALKAKGQ